MKRRKYLVEQSEAPIKILETTIKEVKVKNEDVDTITLYFSLQNGIRFSKKFYKYDFEYQRKWKNIRQGDLVNIQVKANNVIGIL